MLLLLSAIMHLPNSSELHIWMMPLSRSRVLVLLLRAYQGFIWLLPHVTVEGAGFSGLIGVMRLKVSELHLPAQNFQVIPGWKLGWQVAFSNLETEQAIQSGQPSTISGTSQMNFADRAAWGQPTRWSHPVQAWDVAATL